MTGPGTSSTCAQKYVTTLARPEGGLGVITTNLGKNSTSTTISKILQLPNEGPSVVIQDNYTENNDGGFSNCDGGIDSMRSSSPMIPVVVPFTVAGQTIYLGGVLPWSQKYTYTFSSRGNWLFDNLTGSGTGTGVAFYHKSC